MTYADFLQLIEWGVVTLDAYWDAERERGVLKYTWQQPAYLLEILQEHEVDLYLKVFTAVGRVLALSIHFTLRSTKTMLTA